MKSRSMTTRSTSRANSALNCTSIRHRRGATPDYPGEITPYHGLRITPELSWGLTPSFEAGLYLPFVRDAQGDDYFAGPKFRLKWIAQQAPESGGWFYGINTELAVVQSRFAQDRVAIEFRPIVGYRTPDWLVAVNPVLSSPLTQGYRGGGMDFSPGIKLGKTISTGVQAGVEYYTELGKLARFKPASEQSRTLFAVIDVDRKPWVFNLGVGRGLTDATDKWTLKAIFEFPFE